MPSESVGVLLHTECNKMNEKLSDLDFVFRRFNFAEKVRVCVRYEEGEDQLFVEFEISLAIIISIGTHLHSLSVPQHTSTRSLPSRLRLT